MKKEKLMDELAERLGYLDCIIAYLVECGNASDRLCIYRDELKFVESMISILQADEKGLICGTI